MDFTFSPEQVEVRDAVRSFLAREAHPAYVREMFDDPVGCTDGFWSQLVEMGWHSIVVPEVCGGEGRGLLDVVVLAEETGSLPLPGPWLSSAVAGTLMAAAMGDRAVLEDLARWLTARHGRGRGERGPQPVGRDRTVARQRGLRWVLEGTKPVVLDGASADVVYVVAWDPEGLAAYAVDDPRGELVPTLDVTRKVARLELDGRSARRVGPVGDQTHLLARVIDDVGIALCAESVGACDRALRMATEYAKNRVQFGRPIASFQAIKHKIVDMLHQLELARVATHYAAWASDTDDPEREAAAAIAKSVVGEAAAMITGENIQVHGGVGFTWDVDCHLLFRRVKANDLLFGRQAWQRQRLADLVIDAV